MKILIGALHELNGLFVEDGALALAIVVVVALAGLCALVLPSFAWLRGAILLFGCIAVLFFNVMRLQGR
jgi:hypothetical protein